MRVERVTPGRRAPQRLIGAILTRDLVVGEQRWSKGRRLNDADLAALAAGEPGPSVTVLIAEAGELHEDDAALRLAKAVAGPGLEIRGPNQSRMDLLAANHLGRAMYSDLFLDPSAPPNFARHIFLDSSARRFYPHWDLAADLAVANLRTAAGKDPHDKRLHELVGELSTRSEEFRRRWHAHDVRTHGAGVKHFPPRLARDLELAYDSLDLRAEPGLTLTVYAAEPASPTAHAISLLGSLAVTEADQNASQDHDLATS